MSDETKKKLSNNRKEKYADGWSPRIGKLHTEKSKQKNAMSHLGKKMISITGDLNPACRKEVREQISKSRIDRGVAKGEKNGMYGKTHTPEAIEKIFQTSKIKEKDKKQVSKENLKIEFERRKKNLLAELNYKSGLLKYC